MVKLNGGLLSVLVLTTALTGCYMDGQSSNDAGYSTKKSVMHEKTTDQEKAMTHAGQGANEVKRAAAKEPVQAHSPGPKRAAAPQIPVM